MGTEAIKLITGLGETLLGRLMIYDALTMTYRTISIRKDPAAPKVTELVDYEDFCGLTSDWYPGKPPARPSRQESCATLLDSGKRVALIDVREPAEWDINHIEGAQLIPQSLINSGEGLAQLPQDRTPVLYCKTGVRSAEVLAAVQRPVSPTRFTCRVGSWPGPKQMQPDMVMY